MIELFEQIVLNAEKANPEMEVDYRDEEGLLICGLCHTRREKKGRFGPNMPEFTARILCECRGKALDETEKEGDRLKQLRFMKELKKESLMDRRLEIATFDRFKTSNENERNLRLCKRFAYDFDEMLAKSQGLLFFGSVGTGKTYAAACIANYLLEKSVPVVMTSMIKLLDSMQSFSCDDNELIGKLNRAQLLILDDLGTERGTDYALEKVFHVIDSRYRSKKPTIFTTNRTLTQMQQETNPKLIPIYDRIFEMCYPMEFKGLSWRKQEAIKRAEEMALFLEK